MNLKRCVLYLTELTIFVRLLTWTLTNMDQKMQHTDMLNDYLVEDCNYLETDKDLHDLLGFVDDLNIVQLNVRGLIGKQKTLIQETTPANPNKQVDVYLLCETWLNEYNSSIVDIPNYTFIGKHRKNRRGGGVGILIHNALKYKERHDIKLPNESDLEYAFAEVKTNQGNLLIGSMYRPPHTKEKQFLKDYKDLLRQLKMMKDTDILLGMDHNMDLLKVSKHKHTQSFLDYNLEEDLLPTITKPTRISKNCATL